MRIKEQKLISNYTGYKTSYILINLAIIISNVLVFSFFSRSLALAVSVSWVLYSVLTLRKRLQAALPLLFLVACYERPVIDLGVGIIGTIKLFDLFSLSLVLSYFFRNSRMERSIKKLRVDQLSISLAALTLLAAVSGVINFHFNKSIDLEGAKLSIYYAIKITQYLVVFAIIYSIPQTQSGIKRSLDFFLLGLVFVGLVAILQGLQILPTEYYTSHTGGFSYIYSGWAISTLGPNHTHLGIYSVLGLIICFLHMLYKFKFYLLMALFVMLGGLYFSHSSTGVGMLAIFLGLLFLTSNIEKKLLMSIPLCVVAFLVALYLSGNIGGDDSERTKDRLSLGSDSHMVVRSFIRPYNLLSMAYQESPSGMVYGFGFRAPDLNSKYLPRTGDNNYFSVISDIGFFGLVLFLLFLASFLTALMRRRKSKSIRYMKLVSHLIILLFVCIVFAMFSQEIIWPLHSRGNTYVIILCLLSIPLLYENNKITK